MDITNALTFDGLKYFYTKYIKPLKTGAFSTVVNNATTTVANTVLDGRMGKTLADKDANLQNQINTLNSSLNGKKQEVYGSNITFPVDIKEILLFTLSNFSRMEQFVKFTLTSYEYSLPVRRVFMGLADFIPSEFRPKSEQYFLGSQRKQVLSFCYIKQRIFTTK